jgi:trk system potassium uptake protein TrkA
MSSVIVIGGGKVGSRLTSVLIEGGHQVTVVEVRDAQAAQLGDSLGGGRVIVGSGTDASILERAGIRGCQVVAAVTGTDETNLVVASLARFEFGVPRVIARIDDPANAWMFDSDMGVDVALNQADLLAHLVAEEMSMGEMTTLLKLRKGQYALVEEKVAPESPVAGMRIEDVRWPVRCQLVGLIREGELMGPDQGLVLQPADELLAVAHSESVPVLAALLGPPGGVPPSSQG